MTHNTFDIEKRDGSFFCSSHNFPEFEGVGESESEAINDLNRKLIYYKDNNPVAWHKRIKSRIEKGLSCECGVKLNGQILAIMEA